VNAARGPPDECLDIFHITASDKVLQGHIDQLSCILLPGAPAPLDAA
jgi:hypothetical protein